jgi:hypothetical protein
MPLDIGRKSQLSVHNKLLLYKQVLTHLDVWHPALGVCSHKQHKQNTDIPKQGTARYHGIIATIVFTET